jgi:serine/threonine protein kinase/formylglycine-generating enzyme required for sulfatase activity
MDPEDVEETLVQGSPSPSQRFEVSPGQTLGSYRVLEEIARGGQGVVLRAEHVRLGAPVALKLLLDVGDEGLRKRFTQEAKVLARLTHPNLPRVTDLGEVEGQPFLAMELIDGSDLHKLLQQEGIPELAWTVEVLEAVADALGYCHGRGIVHRDLKPQNVLIERESGRPVLTDFGLVKVDPTAAPSMASEGPLSMTGEIKGTPAYMAPEQIDPSFGPVGPRTDVYALGATLYALLTGRAPFQGESVYNLIFAVVQKPTPDPRHEGKVPDAVAEVCRRAMSKSPEERQESAAAFSEDLRAACAGEGRPTARAGPPPTSSERGESVDGRNGARADSSGAPWAIAALVCALVGSALFFGLRGQTSAPGSASASPSVAPSVAPSAEPSAAVSPRRGTQPAGPKDTPVGTPSSTPSLASGSEAKAPPKPSWWEAVPNFSRPDWPPPRGLRADERPLHFVNERDGSVLVYHSGGKTWRGYDKGKNADGALNEGPEARLVVRGFYLGKYEVSRSQYRAFCLQAGSPLPEPQGAAFSRSPPDDWPATGMGRAGAVAYCRWAGLVLPTELEWEHAARGTRKVLFPWGYTQGRDRYNRIGSDRDAFPFLAPVGSMPEGASGLHGRPKLGKACHHLLGNVWEIVAGDYAPRHGGAPTGKAIVRGGGALDGDDQDDFCRATSRDGIDLAATPPDVGFRVAFRPPH